MKYNSVFAFIAICLLLASDIAVAEDDYNSILDLINGGSALPEEQICVSVQDSKILQKCLAIYRAAKTETELQGQQEKRSTLHCQNGGTKLGSKGCFKTKSG